MKKSFVFAVIISLFSCDHASSELNTGDAKVNEVKKITLNKNASHSKNIKPLNQGYFINVPTWYTENRVETYTALKLNDLSSDNFFNFPKTLSALGSTVLERYIKSHDEEPWWPSSVGTQNPLTISYNKNGTNLALSIIKQMHDLNMKAIIYYRHMEDAEMLVLHPDWAARDINGQILHSKRGVYMCLNSPFRNVVATRIKELAAFGADGFYFDEVHIPLKGCFCDYCKARYKKEYGSDLISDYKSGNKVQYYAFRNETIDNFFTDIRTTLHNGGTDPVMLVSANSWPTFTEMHMNSDIFHKFIIKSEYEVAIQASTKKGSFSMPPSFNNNLSPFYWAGFCFSNMRDNSAGPPNIWCPRIKNEDEANRITAAIISLGGIPALDIEPGNADNTIFKNALSWNKQFGQYFKDLVPYSYYGILVSEKQRNSYFENPDQAWSNVIEPAYYTFQKLYQAGIPVQIVSDASFNQENTSNLNKIFCNLSLKKTAVSSVQNKLVDNSSIQSLNNKNLAISLGSPIFCEKQDDHLHFNYFKDKKGYMYIITGPDYTKNITMKSNKNRIVLKRIQSNVISADVKANNFVKLYVKQTDMGANNAIEDLVTNTSIKPTKVDNGYDVYILNPSYASLGLYRFECKL